MLSCWYLPMPAAENKYQGRDDQGELGQTLQRQGWGGDGRGERDQEEQLWGWVVGISSQPLEGMVKWLFGILLGKRV